MERPIILSKNSIKSPCQSIHLLRCSLQIKPAKPITKDSFFTVLV